MLDTVRAKSPPLLEGQAAAVRRRCNRVHAHSGETEEVLWEMTTGQLEGSFDHRLSIRIETSETVPKPGGGTCKVACPPFLVAEGSIHKGLIGHNLSGGPLDPVAAGRWLVDQVADRVGHWLPGADRWQIARIDWAEVYDLGSYEAVEEFIHGLSLVPFPRRKKVQRWGNHSIHAPSDLVTLRVYAKGKEFADHDFSRLKRCLSKEEAELLQETANRLLRVETQLNARKLRAEYDGALPLVSEMTQAKLEAVHDAEVARLLREGKEEMETVRTLREVQKRLREHYSPGLARGLMHTWSMFSLLGEEVVKKDMQRATFYRHRKQLQNVGVSWHATDVQVLPSQSWLPAGFCPVRTSPYRLLEEDLRVRQVLDPYRLPQVAA